VVDSPLTRLEEVIDPPLTSLPFVTPSLCSTSRDTTKGFLRSLCSPFPLAQCTKVEMDESLRDDASCVEADTLDWSGDIALLEPSFEELYSDDMRVRATPSIDHID